MGLLLLLVGLLVLASGGLKLRKRVQSVFGTSRLAILEAATGAAVVLGSGVGLARVRPLAWVVVVSVIVLSLFSNRTHIRTVSRHLRTQEASEGERLKAHLSMREMQKENDE